VQPIYVKDQSDGDMGIHREHCGRIPPIRNQEVLQVGGMMKVNDIVEVYPYGYDEETRLRMGRIAVVTNIEKYNVDLEIKFTDGKRECGLCQRDKVLGDAYRINGRRDVWYAIREIDGE